MLHSVGEKEPNSFGLYDMHGNVSEWVEDECANYHRGAPSDGSERIDALKGSFRVNRGGAWHSSSRECWSASRGFGTPGVRNNTLGFRLSRSVE